MRLQLPISPREMAVWLLKLTVGKHATLVYRGTHWAIMESGNLKT